MSESERRRCEQRIRCDALPYKRCSDTQFVNDEKKLGSAWLTTVIALRRTALWIGSNQARIRNKYILLVSRAVQICVGESELVYHSSVEYASEKCERRRKTAAESRTLEFVWSYRPVDERATVDRR